VQKAPGFVEQAAKTSLEARLTIWETQNGSAPQSASEEQGVVHPSRPGLPHIVGAPGRTKQRVQAPGQACGQVGAVGRTG
jgi:hypothetical protein